MTGALIGANTHGVPRIGNSVMVGGHAIVLGDIVIGDNVQIGAGAIVTHDVPDNAVVVSDAAHILRHSNVEEHEVRIKWDSLIDATSKVNRNYPGTDEKSFAKAQKEIGKYTFDDDEAERLI